MLTSPFSNFAADAMALICESTLISQKLHHYVVHEFAILWSAVRCIERGDANCQTLNAIKSRDLLGKYGANFQHTPAMEGDWIERNQALNSLVTMRQPRGLGEINEEIDASRLIMAVLATYNFKNLIRTVLGDFGIDVFRFHESLGKGNGFESLPSLGKRANIPSELSALHTKACLNASAANEWLITKLAVEIAILNAAVASDLSETCVAKQVAWAKRVDRAHDTGMHFNGIRPLTSEAATIFGITFPEP